MPRKLHSGTSKFDGAPAPIGPYPCPSCKASFSSETERDMHRRQYHGWIPPGGRVTNEQRLTALEEQVRLLSEAIADLKRRVMLE
jgi:hypothetical protein